MRDAIRNLDMQVKILDDQYGYNEYEKARHVDPVALLNAVRNLCNKFYEVERRAREHTSFEVTDKINSPMTEYKSRLVLSAGHSDVSMCKQFVISKEEYWNLIKRELEEKILDMLFKVDIPYNKATFIRKDGDL